ncbi:MAG TPA: RNA polymerase sigma-70 factor [Chitinophaga sp.]
MKRDANLANEKVLLEQLKAGDEVAFTQLYRAYSGQLLVNLLSLVKDEHIAEEIVQDIFTRVWQKRASLQVERQLSAYLYGAARNALVDFYRKLQRDKALYNRFASLADDRFFHIEENLQHKESAALLQKAMDTLPPQQRKVFQLCKLEGLTAREAALQLGISPYTVNEYLAKARLSLRNFFTDHHNNVTMVLLLLWVCL